MILIKFQQNCRKNDDLSIKFRHFENNKDKSQAFGHI